MIGLQLALLLMAVFINSNVAICVTLRLSDLYKVSEKFIRENYKYGSLTMDFLGNPNRVVFSADSQIKLKVLEDYELKECIGIVHIPVGIFAGEQLSKVVKVGIRLIPVKQVVVAKRSFKVGELITQSDIDLQERQLLYSYCSPLTDITQAIGRRTKTFIRAGSIISSEQLQSTETVQVGDLVKIVAEREGIKITAIGEVVKGGSEGEWVKVRNLSSNVIVVAKVRDRNTVVVQW